jgi:hypothetical protein
MEVMQEWESYLDDELRVNHEVQSDSFISKGKEGEKAQLLKLEEMEESSPSHCGL